MLMLTQRGQRQGCFLQHQHQVLPCPGLHGDGTMGQEHPRSMLCF